MDVIVVRTFFSGVLLMYSMEINVNKLILDHISFTRAVYHFYVFDNKQVLHTQKF